MTKRAVDVGWPDGLALAGAGIELLEHFAGDFYAGRRAVEGYDIAVRDGADPEPILEHREIGVVFAEQGGYHTVVLEGNGQPAVCLLRLAALGGAGLGWIAKSCQQALLLYVALRRPHRLSSLNYDAAETARPDRCYLNVETLANHLRPRPPRARVADTAIGR